MGVLFAVLGVLGFSFKAILIKLAYRWDPIDPVALMTLRMAYSAPFFLLMAWWGGRAPGIARMSARDAWMLVGLGFIGYYLSSLLDFIGLQYITAALERLTLFLYPTIVVLLSAWWLKKPITRRAVGALVLSYAGIVLAFARELHASDPAATLLGGGLVFASAVLYAVYLVAAGPVIARLGSSRFIAFVMLISTVFVLAQFALTRPWAALAAPARIQWLSLTMAVFSTVVPTWLIAEAIRRIGASQSSLVGSLGPVFTIGLGAIILGEPTYPLQLIGAALVLAGVMLVSARPAPRARP